MAQHITDFGTECQTALLDGAGLHRGSWPASTPPTDILAWIEQRLCPRDGQRAGAAQLSLFVGQPRALLCEHVVKEGARWSTLRAELHQRLATAPREPVSVLLIHFGEVATAATARDAPVVRFVQTS